MSKVYDEDYKINIQAVLSELEWLPMYDSQISLQTVEGHKGDPDYGTGKLNKLNHIESDFTVPLFPKFKYINKIMNNKLELIYFLIMTLIIKNEQIFEQFFKCSSICKTFVIPPLIITSKFSFVFLISYTKG